MLTLILVVLVGQPGMPYWSGGQAAAQGAPQSLALNGTTAFASAASAPDLNLTADWTVETWFKDESRLGFNHDYVNLVNKGDREANPEAPFFVLVGFKTLVAGLRTDWTDATVRYDLRAGGVNPSDWHHVAASFSSTSGRLSLYLDGARVAEATVTLRSEGNTLPLQIGRNGPRSGKYLTGKLDDVRIWTVVRDAQQIANAYRTQLTDTPTGLAANWKFDEALGDTLLDTTGRHPALLQGAAMLSPDIPFGGPSATPVASPTASGLPNLTFSVTGSGNTNTGAVEFDTTIVNTGTAPASGVVYRLNLSARVGIDSAAVTGGAGGVCAPNVLGDAVTCTIAVLRPVETSTIEIRGQALCPFSGILDMTHVVDPENVIVESNEGDNVASSSMGVFC